jgi:hypothetical protein
MNVSFIGEQCGNHYTKDTVILSEAKDLWSILFVTGYNDPRFFASLRMTKAMDYSNPSPRIKHVSWGRLEVEGEAEPYKDAKLFPGGSRDWNWRETGTSHTPGIQIADVQDLLDHGATVIVLSRGMAECLHVPGETLDFLKERQIAVHVLPTKEAAALYNKLAKAEHVGGLFHTTC